MNEQKKTCTYIGGQAVLEGVMMQGKTAIATAVRDDTGKIQVEAERITPAEKKPLFFRLPFIRGVVNLVNSMVRGTKILMRSAEVYAGEEEEPSAFEKKLAEKYKIDLMSVVTTISLVLGLLLAVGLFVFLPQFLTGLIAGAAGIAVKSIFFNLIEGGFRIVIFILYILLTSLMKDIRRTYMYHGAEHKTITCFELGLPLTVENVKKCSRVHDRCGTTFLFFVMIISILVFSVGNLLIPELESGVLTFVVRFAVKLLLLPVVAGISYELLKLLAKTQSPLVLPFKAPGLALQLLTTREPDEGMIECAITAFERILKMDADKAAPESSFAVGGKLSAIKERIDTLFTRAGIEGEDCQWILSLNLGMPPSNLGEERLVTPAEARKIYDMVNERLTGRPLWYIVGDTSFCGYTIKVDERVLIPRPETETLVENAVRLIDSNENYESVLDLCAGSGGIAVAVKKMVKNPNVRVVAVDISEDALALAKENAEMNGAEMEFVQSNLFESVSEKYDVILSNPPYIKSEEIPALQREVKDYEPRLALDGGEDGLDFYRAIAKECKNYLNDDGFMLLELGMGQVSDVKTLFETEGGKVEVIRDLAGIERIVKVTF